MFKRILVPLDGSESSTNALGAALQLARESDGRVRLLHRLDQLACLPDYAHDPHLAGIARDRAERLLHEAMGVARSSGVPTEACLLEWRADPLGDLVADEAEAWEADLVVVGAHGRRGVNRVGPGSGAEQVVRAAAVPVLCVGGEEAQLAQAG